MMRSDGRCFLCQRRVMPILGESAFFDSYMFESRPEDKHAIEVGACGDAHALCLKYSPWGAFWAEKRERHHALNLGLRPICRDDQYMLFLNRNTMEYSLISDCGILIYLKRKDLKGKAPCDGGYLLSIAEEFREKIPSGTAATDFLSRTTAQPRFSFIDFANIWGLGDTFLRPELVAQAEFESNRNLKRYLRGRLDSVLVTYKVFIPAEMAHLIEAAKPH